ncbi:hypothetical protein KUTeg_007665 [Tegillarca granosa]|uniref:Uncharacterized protein n=1 Tax=Tegillarca granosa TaxID=220873 RepID=A0ABQ9FDW8_TEGGR|nr:hypothetical protein KUTeg_007665 [Tegillarca granosa]
MLTITGTTLRARSIEYKRELVNSFTENILPLFTSGKVKPIVDKTFPLEKISDAHKYMESNQNIGKILLHVRDE